MLVKRWNSLWDIQVIGWLEGKTLNPILQVLFVLMTLITSNALAANPEDAESWVQLHGELSQLKNHATLSSIQQDRLATWDLAKLSEYLPDNRESDITAIQIMEGAIRLRFGDNRYAAFEKAKFNLRKASEGSSAYFLRGGSASEDAIATVEIWSNQPSDPIGPQSGLYIGIDPDDASASWGLFNAPLNSIPAIAESIDLAELVVSVFQVIISGNTGAWAIEDGPNNFWTEGTATWNNRPDLGNFQSQRFIGSSDQGQFVRFEITEIVDKWLFDGHMVNGVALAPPASTFGTFVAWSRYASGGNVPVFYYEYTLPDGSPEIQTVSAIEVTDNSAFLRSNLRTNGSHTTVSFHYGQSSSIPGSYPNALDYGQNPILDQPDFYFADQLLDGLECGTTYYWRPYAENSDGDDWGSESTFETAPCSTSGGCQNVVFEDEVVNQTEIVSSCANLTVRNVSLIDSASLPVNPYAILEAGETVSINPGFSVAQGGQLQVRTCGHNLCKTGESPRYTSCHTCVIDICAVDSSCCNNEWDQICVDRVASICQLGCDE